MHVNGALYIMGSFQGWWLIFLLVTVCTNNNVLYNFQYTQINFCPHKQVPDSRIREIIMDGPGSIRLAGRVLALQGRSELDILLFCLLRGEPLAAVPVVPLVAFLQAEHSGPVCVAVPYCGLLEIPVQVQQFLVRRPFRQLSDIFFGLQKFCRVIRHRRRLQAAQNLIERLRTRPSAENVTPVEVRMRRKHVFSSRNRQNGG